LAEFLSAYGAGLIFYLFAAIAVLGALLVIGLRNPMYGAMALLSTFLSMAVLFLLRHAEFVAMVQIFVYGGGIMVLFLFVIMLINLHRLRETRIFAQHAVLAWGVALLLVGLFVFVFLGIQLEPAAVAEAATVFVSVEGEELGNSQAVAWKLYRDYLLPFEIASVFLLVAMIGAVVLGRKA